MPKDVRSCVCKVLSGSPDPPGDQSRRQWALKWIGRKALAGVQQPFKELSILCNQNYLGVVNLPSMTMVTWSVSNFLIVTPIAWSCKTFKRWSLKESLLECWPRDQKASSDEMSSNFHATPRCPQVPQGALRVRATIHPNKGGWPPHLPPGAAGRKTASAAVALDWHIPALLLHPGADLGWAGHPPCGFRGTEERPNWQPECEKNAFSLNFSWLKDNLTILPREDIQFLKASLALVMGTWCPTFTYIYMK